MSGAEQSNHKKIQLDDERLIELVKINRSLYDVNHSKYVDTAFREKTWNEISQELEQPAFFCKKRWCNIRDNYKKTLRKTTEPGSIGQKRYKYSDRLDFLRVLFDGRSHKPKHVREKPEFIMDDSADTEIFESITQIDSKTIEGGEGGMNAKRVSNTNGSEIRDLFKMMLERLEARSNETSKHPVDVFLSGIAPTLKGLSPYYLSLAKTKIYSVVQDHEMAMIMAQKKNKD